MLEFCGKGVCGGIAIGTVKVFGNRQEAVRRISTDDTDREKERFENAKKRALEQLSEIYSKALVEVGEATAEIFSIHMMMVEDEDYNESVINIIESNRVNAEYAVAVTGENFASMFSLMDDAYMRARGEDVKDI